MNFTDESQLADQRLAFLRILPRRVEGVGRRLHRFLQDGWDINGLSLMREDAEALGLQCLRFDLADAGDNLCAMGSLLGETLSQQTLPDPALGERLWNLVEELSGSLPHAPEEPLEASAPIGNSARVETPPARYWRRWGGEDAPPAVLTVEVAKVAPTRAADPWAREAPMVAAAVMEEEEEDEIVVAPAPPAAVDEAPRSLDQTPRIYHLSDYGALSLELDQRMEALRYEVELLSDTEEMQELLGALPADLVLVDAAFSEHLDAIGESVRLSKQRSGKRVLLVALSEADDVAFRLSARRAGVDALVVGANGANDVLKRLQTLLDPTREAPYRVLIVEDDRSQALFAEGILRNTGMETMVVLEAMGVMPAMERFQPDLVLMDLHMPQANGIELTGLIREQEAFLDTPIVFLSGESDQDRQFDALDAGGDDFLAKPIRPRYLIASVQNRVQRHRAKQAKQKRRPSRDASTGLLERTSLLEQLGQALSGAGEKSPGGVLFLEIESLNLLRDRLGLTAMESLMADASRLINEKCDGAAAGRFSDGSYLVLDLRRDDAGLDALAAQLRNALAQHHFQVQGQDFRLRASAGICALRHRFADPGTLLNAAEKSAREARVLERGYKRYEPPKASEAAREAALISQIRSAISDHSLELLYQPVVAVAGSDDSQYQVLLRLRSADGRLLSAAEVVPMAERGDFIVDIDRWVLLQALSLIRDRRAEGRPLRLFVTQSPMTLADNGQAPWLKTELVAHDVPGTSLVVEVRMEDAALHAATIKQFCEALIADGVQFCLSQFEAGPEAETLLEQMPLGFVKLARKYTAGSMAPALREELRLIIERSHRRGLEVIGHGVEDAQSAATLWMSGIDFIQGNLVQQADRGLNFDFQQAVL